MQRNRKGCLIWTLKFSCSSMEKFDNISVIFEGVDPILKGKPIDVLRVNVLFGGALGFC